MSVDGKPTLCGECKTEQTPDEFFGEEGRCVNCGLENFCWTCFDKFVFNVYTEIPREKHIEKEKERYRAREEDREKERETQRERHRERHRERETERHRDRQRETERDRERQRQT
jgi:transposase